MRVGWQNCLPFASLAENLIYLFCGCFFCFLLQNGQICGATHAALRVQDANGHRWYAATTGRQPVVNIVERRFQKDKVSVTLSTMNKLIQMGKDLGYEGQALQEFVKQQQAFEKQQHDTERSERLQRGRWRKKESRQRKIRLHRFKRIEK